MNPGHPEYETGELTTRPQCLVSHLGAIQANKSKHLKNSRYYGNKSKGPMDPVLIDF
jgi:hypothetical protein